ncbi:glutamine amidotransferase-related protein [Streptomyces adustus]|uniref:glutamine amidotransferase-related protein n=1 Tax=Streptomyces adustus TaxID=1609272 RepID=UPI003714C581
MPVDVQICVADGLIYDGLDYADRIEQRLTRAGLSCGRLNLPAEVADVAARLPRPNLAYVFTGGQTSVHSDAAWMRATVALVRELIADTDRPGGGAASAGPGPAVIGVCLGSQLIAEALRPDSIIGTSGMEVGLTPVCRAGDGHRSRDGDHGVHVVPSFHYQAISPRIEEVDGVRVEYRNDHTSVQALSFGERVFGYQFHPELTSDDVRRLIDFNKDVITEWNGDPEAAHRSVERYQLHDDLFERLVIDRIRR